MPYQIQCSTCGLKLLVREHALGKRVRCSKCKTEFIAKAGAGELIEEDHEPAPPHPPPDRRDDADDPSRADDERDRDGPRRRRDEDWDEDDSGPRRRGRDRDRPDARRSPRRGRDEDEEEDRPRKRRPRRRSADDMLRGPALGLQIVAYAGGGINVLFLILNLAGAVSIEGVSGGKKALSCVAGALITGVWVTLVAKGAAAMSSQYSYPMAITGCFVAMVPCSWGFLGGIPIGIWGLVILFREEVKREFR